MDLSALFNPKSVAVIGASRKPMSVGQGILKNLMKGGTFPTKCNQPFRGKIYPVNPNVAKLMGLPCYPSLEAIKGEVDLAVIAVNARLVPRVVKECVQKKVKGIIVISAGFGELGAEGKTIQEEVAHFTKRLGIPLVGPNCLGIINPHSSLNASFAPAMPPKGNIGFISQSGALADSVIDWAIEKEYGFSKLISYGNAASLEVTDFIEYLENDKDTKAIAIYLESIKDGRRFMDAARKAKKPIAIIKAGQTESGIKAVSSHTGSLAGSYEIYKAAFKQCSLHTVTNVDRLFEAAWIMAHEPKLKENSIAIITNGGGAGVLCADNCAEHGIKLAQLSGETIDMMDESGKMHPAWSRNNPIDVVGDALPERYEVAINAALNQSDIQGLIVIQTLQTMTDPIQDAKIIINARKKFKGKPVIAVYMGGQFTKKGRDFLKQNNVPVFDQPHKAVQAMKALLYKR